MLHQSNQSEAQRAAILAIGKMREEVRNADRDSLYCLDPSWYSFASWSKPDGSMGWTNLGELNWQRWDIFYFDSTQQKLFLQLQPINPPQVTLVPAECQNLTVSPQDLQVARDISSMQCRVLAGGGIFIDLRTQVADGHSQIITTLNPATTKPGSNPNAVLDTP